MPVVSDNWRNAIAVVKKEKRCLSKSTIKRCLNHSDFALLLLVLYHHHCDKYITWIQNDEPRTKGMKPNSTKLGMDVERYNAYITLYKKTWKKSEHFDGWMRKGQDLYVAELQDTELDDEQVQGYTPIDSITANHGALGWETDGSDDDQD